MGTNLFVNMAPDAPRLSRAYERVDCRRVRLLPHDAGHRWLC